ncbi:MAG: GGDEF domain-containing protein [Rubripirellula sp.]|nr:GGDEF domain-containing protein [Rubripirellula sp.]
MSVTTETEPAAFALAKRALALVGEHQTPPTPKVYEVWFRYAEGECPAIREQLDHVIKETGTVSAEFMEQLHDQFCAQRNPANDHVSDVLDKELAQLQKLIVSQLSAGNEFKSSIDSASEAITPRSEISSVEITHGIEQLLRSNQAMQTKLTEMGSRLQESQGQVDILRQNLLDSQKTMLTDPLTGTGNRRFFDQLLNAAVEKADRDVPAFLILIDLDGFKGINDKFGHAAGDQVLKFVATETCKLRSDFSLARYGGDEFAIFMEAAGAEEADEFASELRHHFSTRSLRFSRSKELLGRISMSIGVARLRPDDDRASWFDRADGLLYRAKESGRNCVMTERLGHLKR